MNLRLRSSLRRVSVVALSCVFNLFVLAATSSGYTVRKNQSEAFYQSTPLTYTPGRSTPAVAETTIRHQVFFGDLEGGGAGWSVINWRTGTPVRWRQVSGSQSCADTAWWCGQTGLPHGDGYGNNWVQSLTSNVPINIGGFNNTQLTFKSRFRAEYIYDWGWVLIKGGNAGALWDTLASFSGDFGATCSNYSLDIPDSFNTVTQPVTIQFLFGSDLSISMEDTTGAYTGWSVDDITVKSGGTTHFSDDVENGSTKMIASAPAPSAIWHLENAPGTSLPALCFFLSTNVFVPFQGSGFGVVPDHSDQMLVTPPMDLQGVFSPATPTTTLKLQLDQWINLPPDNSVYWSLWIQGSDDKVTWTPWKNALHPWEFSGGNPQCIEGLTRDFDPYETSRTGVTPGTRYIKLGIRLRDEKAVDGCQCGGPLKLGVSTEGMYVDNLGVYYVYTISGVETVSGVPVASRPSIQKAFPNPFNPYTTIEFSVPKSGPVRVGVFDVHGRRVASLVDQTMGPGVYRVRWDGKGTGGSEVGSGVYYAYIQSKGGSDSGRLALIK